MPSIVAGVLDEVRLGDSQCEGRLSVVPLLRAHEVAGDGRPVFQCVPLDAALEAGTFEVTEVSERGTVPELQVVNGGPLPVFLLDGEELSGAKQNRIINVSLMIPARSSVTIPVSCVEAHRWSRTSRSFRTSGNLLYARGRARKVARVHDSLAATGRADTDQDGIWDDIDAKASRLEARSGTAAMSRLYEVHEPAIERYQQAFTRRPGQRGAVFLLDGEPMGFELFEDERLFEALFPKIVRSYALEAIDTPLPGVLALGARDTGSQAADLLHPVMTVAVTLEQRFRAAGMGETITVDALTVLAAGLDVEGHLVHLAGFPRMPASL